MKKDKQKSSYHFVAINKIDWIILTIYNKTAAICK